MTTDHARLLQSAVNRQHTERLRLITARDPAEVQAAAEAYLQATDDCYTVAVEIKGHA